MSAGIYLEKVSDHQYGFPIVADVYHQVGDNFTETETQVTETTFQISAMVTQNPTDLTIPTASDVAQFMKRFIQTRVTIDLWNSQEVSMLRVTDVRNPYFVDDRDRFEGYPNFDIVVIHSNSVVTTIPVVSQIVGAPSTIPGDNTRGVFSVPDDAGETA